jgi:hypothetical protein
MALKLKDDAKADFLAPDENQVLGAKPKPDDEKKVDTKPEAAAEKPELKVEQKEEQSQDDGAAAALQKQIEDLKKASETERQRSEQLARERAEVIKYAQQREAELSKIQRQAQDSNYDAISSALAAATSAAEKAQLDIEYAIANGDPKAQAEAYRRLAKAETAISTLEAGKEELDAAKRQAEEQAKRPQPQPQPRRQPADPLENVNLPDSAKNWLRAHPDFLTDSRKNAKIQALHYDVVDEGHAPFSTAYFESLEQHLGMRKASAAGAGDGGGSIVSAPVTRDGPASSGGGGRQTRITLTKEQKDAAKMAGITEQEYAKNLIKMNELKANGSYGEAR